MMKPIMSLLPRQTQQAIPPFELRSTPQPPIALAPIRIPLTDMMLAPQVCPTSTKLQVEGALCSPMIAFSASHHPFALLESKTQSMNSMDNSLRVQLCNWTNAWKRSSESSSSPEAKTRSIPIHPKHLRGTNLD